MQPIINKFTCPCGIEWHERESDLKEKPENPHLVHFCEGFAVYQEHLGFGRFYEKAKTQETLPTMQDMQTETGE